MIGLAWPLRMPSRPSDDAVLMQRLADGDLGALGELYDRYARQLMRFAARLTRFDEAEDVVHGVFLRVVRLAPEFDASSTSARPWLYALTARAAQERRRSLRRWAALLLQVAEQGAPRTTVLREVNHELERALMRLKPQQREVLLLAEVEGFTGDEIAGLLGIPVGTVWTRLYHARRTLREILGPQR